MKQRLFKKDSRYPVTKDSRYLSIMDNRYLWRQIAVISPPEYRLSALTGKSYRLRRRCGFEPGARP
jgi:hypothetical protein